MPFSRMPGKQRNCYYLLIIIFSFGWGNSDTDFMSKRTSI